jgi:nucleoside-diphosphate kinase
MLLVVRGNSKFSLPWVLYKFNSKSFYMTGNQTFTMIKPVAVRSNYIGPILKMINEAGFRIKAMKFTHLTKQQASDFYAVHADKYFFEDLTSFMSSGPIVAAILEKENAVADFRKLIGATDPAKAEEGTIRKLYAESMSHNAVHGSDSDENAIIESDFFFSKMERY